MTPQESTEALVNISQIITGLLCGVGLGILMWVTYSDKALTWPIIIRRGLEVLVLGICYAVFLFGLFYFAFYTF